MSFTPADRIKNVRKSATRRLYDAAPAGSINFGLGEPDFPTPEIAKREAIRVVEDGYISYTPNAGLPALREQIANYHSEGLENPYSPNSVCVMTGAEEALFAAVMALVNPGDEVLLADPCFLAYPTIVEIAGGITTRYSLPAAQGFAFDRENFQAAVTDKTKLLFINSPSNPISRILTRDDLQFMAACLKGSNVYIIADEIYRELYFEERAASISEFYDRTIIVSGISKMMSMTGWRIGWAVGAEEIIQPVTVMHQYISTCAAMVSQKAALTAFSEAGRQATADIRNALRQRRDLATELIEREVKLPFVSGEGAYYIMLDISRFGTSEAVAWSLLDAGVITVPGSAFGSQGEGYLRLSYSIQPHLIEEGIRRLVKGLQSL